MKMLDLKVHWEVKYLIEESSKAKTYAIMPI